MKKVVIVTDNPDVDTKEMRHHVYQLPGLQDGKRKHLAYDSLKTVMSCRDLTSALQNNGYLNAEVSSSVSVRPNTTSRRNPQCEVTYKLHPHQPYKLSALYYDIRDARIDSLLRGSILTSSHLAVGKQFSVSDLNAERVMITKYLQDNGYYKFNKEFVRFEADTVSHQHAISLTLILEPYKANARASEEPHPYYIIRNINYHTGNSADTIRLRKSVLDENTILQADHPYNASALQSTYQRFGRLQALRYTNIRFSEFNDSLAIPTSSTMNHSAADTTLLQHTSESSFGLEEHQLTPSARYLDCDITISPRKPNTISVQPEGTNTAGDLGAAVSLTYENRNVFHGSETFSLQLRGAYEAITGLEGYNNQDYIEYGVEGKIQFPRFILPFISRSFKRNVLSTSELSIAYNSQNRPEFHRRVFSAALRYKWAEPNHHTSYKIDLLDLNYIRMPWISETFKHDYLDSVSNRNAILRYNYEDLFIMKIGFGITYNNTHNAIKFNVETAGNILRGLSGLCSFRKNDDNQYTLFNIAYAQYVKGDIDATHIFKLGTASELVLHGGLGIAYPYGNSNVLPFEKRYFSGGANSVRGWSVRSLGPGTYKGSDGRIDFINQTGDIKLDLNLEYRWFLFWKIYGAAFIDAGNIWTIREYDSQPGGQFRIGEFYKQLAAAYGLGVRFNFGYFILRFDCGMKAVNPAYTTSREHYPLLHPRLSRDFDFHFAVGLPF